MKTIQNEIVNEIIINKSRFITIIIPITKIEDINKKIEILKSIYKDATHYCYAYIINSREKCEDDGEPNGTAGMPILNILKNNNLTNILCVVIRYFGGIKLGSGGLIRAYSASAKMALKKAKIGYMEKGYEIDIEFDYDKMKKINFFLRNIKIKKTFDEKIIYTFKISKTNYNNIKDIIKNYSKVLNIKDAIIIKDEN